MAVLLQYQGVETEAELAEWLSVPESSDLLRSIRGVGPKTFDYLCSLVGRPAIAIDRHLLTFASWAGVTARPYDEMATIFQAAAHLLDVEYVTLDRTVWEYVRQSSQ